MDALLRSRRLEALSKHPAIRRDIAIIVKEDVSVRQIREKIVDSGGDLLKSVNLFDVYRGEGIKEGHKSLALGLNIQHPSRTLKDDEVAKLVQQVVASLEKAYDVELRD